MMTLTEKNRVLTTTLADMGTVLVAFSGGIDSTVVLKAALDTLGQDNVLAVVANSELFTDDEYNKAIQLAKQLGANVEGVTLNYLSDEHIENNTPETWYYSKKMFYQRMNEIAAAHDIHHVLDGMIMDDNDDFRPGLVARNEAGAESVLQLADFYKTDVRVAAQEMGLTNWNKVASCSVSSRFEYNTKLTLAKINRVMAAEKALRQLGFPTVRVRDHGEIARVEVPSDQLADFTALAATINDQLQAFGYEFVTLDLAGFKSGRMNEQLDEATKVALMA
ncbi:ATP-dependent sacrificial sulfur transferase LarE [Furfurilactobacillus sp. WILCCON 0119]